MASLGFRSGGACMDRAHRFKNQARVPQTVQCSLSMKTEKLDRWMKESVVEIVKNLKEAPLFVHVYGDGIGTTLKAESTATEEWAQLKGRWVRGEEPCPEGIILVEELKEEEYEGQNGKNTKAWGVLIQGKGEDGGVACYLLKTSKVGCGNLGLFSTHFCLVRVTNFRETAKSQLTSCWLV